MQKVAFIASLSHSGSTLLDLIVGGHPKCVGLGEIARVLIPGPMGLEKTRQVLCSCGNKMDDCIFWGKVAKALEGKEDLSIKEKYPFVLEIFKEVFGEDHVLVDSSKYVAPLDIWHTMPEIDLNVLLIIKDVRTYTISQLDYDKKYRDKFSVKSIPAYLFWRWYRSNRHLQNFIKNKNIQYYKMGYEELCLKPKFITEKICNFLGQEPDPAMLSIKQSGSHVIRGNMMRSQSGKREGIMYDHRWFHRREWILSAALFPNIMKFNTEQVYSNETTKIW